MNPSTLIGIAASLLLLVGVLVLSVDPAATFLNLPGLTIVLVGTLAAGFISYPLREVLRVTRLVALIFRHEHSQAEHDIQDLVHLARLWCSGDVRGVERMLASVPNPFLRTGVELLIANTPEHEILDLLHWRIARLKARERAEAQIFRTLALYAPAFGMLGTLVGLVNMLATLDTSDIGVIGGHMATALLSTFYGIVLANLILKPIAVKLERRTEERLILMNMILEGISMMSRRRLPAFIEETLRAFIVDHRDELSDAPDGPSRRPLNTTAERNSAQTPAESPHA